jgi:hypothetical protein
LYEDAKDAITTLTGLMKSASDSAIRIRLGEGGGVSSAHSHSSRCGEIPM